MAEYCRKTSAKKVTLANLLRLSRFRLYGALYPDRYPVVLTDEEVSRIADLLNQTPLYVRKLYTQKAA